MKLSSIEPLALGMPGILEWLIILMVAIVVIGLILRSRSRGRTQQGFPVIPPPPAPPGESDTRGRLP